MFNSMFCKYKAPCGICTKYDKPCKEICGEKHKKHQPQPKIIGGYQPISTSNEIPNPPTTDSIAERPRDKNLEIIISGNLFKLR